MKKMLRHDFRLIICILVLLLGIVSFACCITAEFNKVKEKDMKLDGSLCSLPRTSAFGLGITVLVCLSAAQIIGTSAVGTSLCFRNKTDAKNQAASITLLALSWLFCGLAAIMLATATSINSGQSYGKGWMNGECYIVHDGIYAISAVLIIVIVSLIIGFIFTTRKTCQHQSDIISKTCTITSKDNNADFSEKQLQIDKI